MCLILFGYKISKKYPLVLIANRDEFYQRPTAPMHFWDNNPSILAGKDLEQGGTWFGIHKNGRFAALTNYRDPSALRQNAPSRGDIIVDFLESDLPAETFFPSFKKNVERYNGFNLLFGDPETLFWFSNLKNTVEKVTPGIHGLSNRFLDTPWPKVETGKRKLGNALNHSMTPDSLFSILADQDVPDDALLPDTGMTLEWERLLSPLYIQSETYGTRSSIVMQMNQGENIEVVERTYSPEDKKAYKDRQFRIQSNSHINGAK